MTETAWLVELPNPARWVGFEKGAPIWTDDPEKALRFARKEDADNFLSWWCLTAISTEHIWIDDLHLVD